SPEAVALQAPVVAIAAGTVGRASDPDIAGPGRADGQVVLAVQVGNAAAVEGAGDVGADVVVEDLQARPGIKVRRNSQPADDVAGTDVAATDKAVVHAGVGGNAAARRVDDGATVGPEADDVALYGLAAGSKVDLEAHITADHVAGTRAGGGIAGRPS